MLNITALKNHISLHPALRPQDIIKFLYQAEFGCGHLITNYSAAHERFCEEWELASNSNEDIFEPLSSAFCRVNLAAAKTAGLSQSMLWRMFFESARPCGSEANLAQGLEQVCVSAEKGELNINASEMRFAVEQYKLKGMPLISHSSEYHALHRPSYRVIAEDFRFFMPLFKQVFKQMREVSAPIIVIDGMASAGKTTLAMLLQRIIPCNLVHADSFFLPLELRVSERLEQLGGRLHFERLQSEVIDKLSEPYDFSYRLFDCQKMDFLGEGRIIHGLPTIFEGSYSTHPSLRLNASITVFLKLSGERQQQRILHRNGKELLKRFNAEWIPAENAFFEANRTALNSDFVFEA